MPDGSVRALLRSRWFRWLFGTRLLSQAADGLFQASLASAVFFNPDHQTDPRQAAAGFVVLLLPYSLVGPFAGVFLDRWSRQRVLVRANVIRCVFVLATAACLLGPGARGAGFYVAALAALSVNRFYLSALSAALPHVVTPPRLLLANSMTTTSGTAATIVGLGVGLGLRHATGPGDHGNAVIAASSCAVYLAAAATAARMPVRLLGPLTPAGPLGAAARAVVRGLVAGAREVLRHRSTTQALAVMAGARLLFGMSTIGTLLLYRNYFHDEGVLRAGIVGLGQAFAVSAVGYVTAAVVTPVVTTRLGKPAWIVLVFAGAAVAQVGLGLPFAMAPLLAGALVLGFATQSAKICVDTIVQEEIDDDFRGRVFSFYDTLFNLTFVAAAVVAAVVLPRNGKSYPVLIGIGCGYALIAALYAVARRPATTELTDRAAAAAG
jgi:MFS family permease